LENFVQRAEIQNGEIRILASPILGAAQITSAFVLEIDYGTREA
jgi:hypothetical protein